MFRSLRYERHWKRSGNYKSKERRGPENSFQHLQLSRQPPGDIFISHPPPAAQFHIQTLFRSGTLTTAISGSCGRMISFETKITRLLSSGRNNDIWVTAQLSQETSSFKITFCCFVFFVFYCVLIQCAELSALGDVPFILSTHCPSDAALWYGVNWFTPECLSSGIRTLSKWLNAHRGSVLKKSFHPSHFPWTLRKTLPSNRSTLHQTAKTISVPEPTPHLTLHW